jgi:hypothetical protein
MVAHSANQRHMIRQRSKFLARSSTQRGLWSNTTIAGHAYPHRSGAIREIVVASEGWAAPMRFSAGHLISLISRRISPRYRS